MERIAQAAEVFPFDRLYGNLGGTIATNVRSVMGCSADRYIF